MSTINHVNYNMSLPMQIMDYNYKACPDCAHKIPKSCSLKQKSCSLKSIKVAQKLPEIKKVATKIQKVCTLYH